MEPNRIIFFLYYFGMQSGLKYFNVWLKFILIVYVFVESGSPWSVVLWLRMTIFVLVMSIFYTKKFLWWGMGAIFIWGYKKVLEYSEWLCWSVKLVVVGSPLWFMIPLAQIVV